MREYRYKTNSDIDAYGDSQSVIHFKFGDARKQYFFTKEFKSKHPKFCAEYEKYWQHEDSLFTDPLSIVNYIEWFNLPVRLYSNFADEEFADFDAAREWLNHEYGGQLPERDKLYRYNDGGYTGLDGEVAK
jgi:hypothetical protein